MALAPQILDLPFATGMQQKADPRVLQVGAQTSITNGVIDKSGQLCKRPGTTSLTPTTTSQALGSRGRIFRNVLGGLAQISGQRLFSYAPNLPAWVPVDQISRIVPFRYGISSTLSAASSFDVAVGSGYQVVVWASGSAGYFAVYDVTTGAPVYGPQDLGSAGGVTVDEIKVCITNAKAIIVCQNAAAPATLFAYTFTLSTFALSASTALVTDNSFRAIWDVRTMDGVSNRWLLAHGVNIGVSQMRVRLYDSALATIATTTTTPPAGFSGAGTRIYGIAVHGTATENVWLAYSCLNNALSDNYQRVIGFNDSLSAVTTADAALWNETGNQTYKLGIERYNTTECVVVGSPNAATFTKYRRQTSGGPAGAGPRILYGYFVASKPFTLDGLRCCLVTTVDQNGTAAPSYQLVDLDPATTATNEPPRPIATIAPRIVNTGTATSLRSIPSAPVLDFYRVVTIGTSVRNATGGTGVDGIVLESSRATNKVVRLGETVYVSGGVPSCYDGQQVSECGFLHQPLSVGLTPAAAGGAMATGSYTYAVRFEWRSATGERVQSPFLISNPVAVTGPTGQVTLTVPCYHLSTRQDQDRTATIAVAVYRTTLAATGVFYRVFSANIPSTARSFTAQLNTTYVDTLDDASISSNPFEILNLSALNGVSPSAFSDLITHNGRLVGVGDDGVTLWFSTQYDGGSNQPRFCDELTLYVAEGGRITALASMDGQLIVFKRDSIYVIGGDGPTDTGTGSTWADPRRVANDVGCTSDWRSVCETAQGVLFQSERKIMLLTRGFELQEFSQPVEDELRTYPVVTFVRSHPTRDEIRIGLRDSDFSPTVGEVVNYNTVTGCWSRFDYQDQDGFPHQYFEDGRSIDGTFYVIDLSGYVRQERTDLTATNSYQDDSFWVPLSVETANAKAAGLQGWGRWWNAYVLGEQSSPHDLTIQVATDYSATYTQSQTFTASTMASWSTPLEQAYLNIANQLGSALRVRIVDAAPTGMASTTGAGPKLLGISLEYGTFPRAKRMPSVQGG